MPLINEFGPRAGNRSFANCLRPALAVSFLASLLLVAAGASAGQVQPPGSTGCADGLTKSTADPRAQLPATAVFVGGERKVRMIVANPTQTTKATIRAYLLDGRRADAEKSGEYTCTVPGPQNTIAFPVKPGTVGPAIRRHGTVKLRVRFLMVNASGRTGVLHRVITVTREQAAAPHFVG